MSVYAWVRVVGVAAILLFGLYGMLGSSGGLLAIPLLFQVINTALLFLLVTLMYEFLQRRT